MFSRRASRDQSPNAIAARLVQVGKPRFDLTSSNPTLAGIDYPDDLLRILVRAQTASLTYRPEPLGLPSARAAVARVTGREPRDILLSASTSEAYGFLFKLLCDPGDAVLVPAPSYPLFEHLAELDAVEAQPYRLEYDGAWHIDLDSLRRAVTPRTRAIVLVSPNNPTGHYVLPSELTAIAELGLPLICDQVFAEFPLRMRAHDVSALPDSCLGFTLDGLSKRGGSPQLKLAWTLISGPERLRREAAERLALIADTYLSVGAPIQHALPELLELCPSITRSIAARCRENASLLARLVAESPVTMLHPDAGWSAVLRLPRIASEEELVLGLLEQQGVLVQPGWFYDFESEPFVVVSLLGEPRAFREAGARLVDHFTRLCGGG